MAIPAMTISRMATALMGMAGTDRFPPAPAGG
jgi:hypothetical protein